MVGDHFSYEVGGDAVGGTGVFHLTKHVFFDLIDSGLVAAQIFLAVVNIGAVAQDFCICVIPLVCWVMIFRAMF